jgi:hypothetical protein
VTYLTAMAEASAGEGRGGGERGGGLGGGERGGGQACVPTNTKIRDDKSIIKMETDTNCDEVFLSSLSSVKIANLSNHLESRKT